MNLAGSCVRYFTGCLVVVLVILGSLAGCGDGPPSSKSKEVIEKAVTGGREDVEMSSYSLGGWKARDGEKEYDTTFTATVKLKEPLGIVLSEVNGKNIVRVVGKEGTELTFTGKAHSSKEPDGWQMSAFVDDNKGGWSVLENKAGPITMGYPVIGDQYRLNAMRHTIGLGAGSYLLPLSQMQPCILEDSAEMKTMAAQIQEQQKKDQQATAERQRQQQLAAAEKQKQADAARQAKIDDQKQKVAQDRVARLLPLLQPFKSKSGVAVVTATDLTMSVLLTEMEVDETALTVKGKGIDLREMPFKEIAFDGVVTDRGLALTSPIWANPLLFATARDKGLAGTAGASVIILPDDDRAHLDKIIAQAAQLSSTTPAALQVEALDAVALKARQAEMQFAPLPGAVLFRGKNAPTMTSLFAGDPAAKKTHAWKKESLNLRLTESVRGKGLYILCGAVPIDHLTVVINGVHRAAVDAVAKNGAAIVTLPADLDVLDLRFEVEGSASSRGIMLIK